MITIEQLIKLGASKESAEKFHPYLVEAMTKFGITEKETIRHFLSQVYHESGCLKIVNENLNYSAERLMVVYPKRFKDIETARKYERNSKLLSELLYNGFHGRGLIQLTHKYNYESCGAGLGVDFVNNKALLQEPKYACLSACWFWSKNKLNELGKTPGEEQVKKITRVINGGYNGIDDRIKLYRKAKEIIC